ncbi:MAG: 1-acyl-sn-glycerol-3-phosphate acyltransferase [Alloprevotella sp.]|nr:1-acyl-sn-glycerol-3-phosphate acyltransferase [Alloprevotella sp.]
MIYRLYQLFIALPLGILITMFTSVVVIVGSIFNAHFWGYWPAHIWSRCICRLLLLPVSVKGRENLQKHQSYVFVANHQGPMDIFLIYGYLNRNFKWMMKKSLRRLPLVGYACNKARHIFVDKSGPKAISRTYQTARDTLQGGTSLVVFPEGARTFTGHMGLFRKGAFQLADEIGLPIVPITINGSFDVLRRQDGFNFVKRHKLELIIHEPIPAGQSADRRTQAYETIMNGLEKKYQGYIKNDDQ